MDKLLKYYLRKYNTGSAVWEYYQLDNTGAVVLNTTKTELQFAPQGWRDETLRWERGFKYWGVMQSFSLPLEFVRDGAKILRYLYFTFGVDAEVQFYIEMLDRSIATYGYAAHYEGDVDFSTFMDKSDFVSVQIAENGFIGKLLAKESTEIEIPVTTNADVVWVRMDGIDLQARARYTGIIQPDNSHVLQTTSGYNIPFLQWFMTEGYANGDIYPKGSGENFGAYNSFYTQVAGGVISLAMGPQYMIHNTNASLSYDVRLTGTFKIQSFNNLLVNTTMRLRAFRFVIGTATILQDHSLVDGATIGPSSAVTDELAIDSTITLAPDEGLIILFYYPGSTNNVDARVLSFDLSVEWLNKVKQTYIPALKPKTVAEALVAFIDPDATLSATPLDDYEDYLLTSGDALRLLDNATLKTSWQDAYTAFDMLIHLGFFFDKANNTAEIRYRADVFDSGTTIDLGDVNELEIKPHTALMFGRMKTGYKAKTYNELNSKEEFNTQYEFQSPLDRVTAALDMTSPYSADMTGIELTRANLTNKKLADNESDNERFWVHIDGSAPAGTIPAGLPGAGSDYYDLYRDNTLTITGLTSPATAFNIDLSPKRQMRTHGPTLKSILHPDNNAALEFVNSFKTTNSGDGLQTDDGVQIIIEKGSEQIDDLPGDKLFYPVEFTMKTMIPQSILTMLTNPFVRFQFTYKGKVGYGWALEIFDQTVTKPTQTYRLLCTPDTDLTDFIV